MADAEFDPYVPFGIDEGELDGLSPQLCFVLGAEFQLVLIQGREPHPFARPVHAENRGRLEAVLRQLGREFSLTHMHDDVSESWLWLDVAPQS